MLYHLGINLDYVKDAYTDVDPQRKHSYLQVESNQEHLNLFRET